MTISLALYAICLFPFFVLSVAAIIAIGKRPGFRRRGCSSFNGVERRCSRRLICSEVPGCTAPPSSCPLKIRVAE